MNVKARQCFIKALESATLSTNSNTHSQLISHLHFLVAYSELLHDYFISFSQKQSTNEIATQEIKNEHPFQTSHPTTFSTVQSQQSISTSGNSESSVSEQAITTTTTATTIISNSPIEHLIKAIQVRFFIHFLFVFFEVFFFDDSLFLDQRFTIQCLECHWTCLSLEIQKSCRRQISL